MDRTKFEEMLERLINEDRDGAQELFHEIVVEKSREIYESLLEDEEVEEADDEEVEESDEEVEEAKDEDEDDEEMSEDFDLDEFEVEADPMDMGGDPADDMMGDIEDDGDEMDMDMDMGDEGGDDDEVEDRVDDLEDALDELKAEFEKLMSGEEGEAGDEMDMDDEESDMDDEEDDTEEAFAFEADDEEVDEADDEEVDEADEEVEEKSSAEQMREYVEKVAGGHGAESKGKGEDGGVNKKSTVDNMKNDMGGTTQNILRSDTEESGEANKGALKGSALSDTSPKDMSTGNVNVPGGKAAKAGKTVPAGHGAEKKGKPEGADKSADSTLNKVSTRAK